MTDQAPQNQQKFVRVIGFPFENNCDFTLGKIYEVFTSYDCLPDGEEWAYDDEGRRNFAISNCVIAEAVSM
ncbi:hypothetical protein D3C75_948670 [compost metagenome]